MCLCVMCGWGNDGRGTAWIQGQKLSHALPDALDDLEDGCKYKETTE